MSVTHTHVTRRGDGVWSAAEAQRGPQPGLRKASPSSATKGSRGQREPGEARGTNRRAAVPGNTSQRRAADTSGAACGDKPACPRPKSSGGFSGPGSPVDSGCPRSRPLSAKASLSSARGPCLGAGETEAPHRCRAGRRTEEHLSPGPATLHSAALNRLHHAALPPRLEKGAPAAKRCPAGCEQFRGRVMSQPSVTKHVQTDQRVTG